MKDCLNREGDVESIKVSKFFIKFCQDIVHAGACRREKAGIKSKRNSHKSSRARKETGNLKEIDNDLAMIKSVIEIAENSIKDDNRI